MRDVEIRLLPGFDSSDLSNAQWEGLLASGDTDEVFLTRAWLQSWWEVFGRGKLLLLLAIREGRLSALAPFFVDSGMIYFVGAGGSDYLDFIGDISDPDLLDALLQKARDEAPQFLGFVFHHVPDSSRTGRLLFRSAERLRFTCIDEGGMNASALDFRGDPELALAAANKKSLVRHQRVLERDGPLELRRLQPAAPVEPWLHILFEQHIERWSTTSHPSLFLDQAWRDFFLEIAVRGQAEGWLRFDILFWNDQPVACHFGFHRKGSYFWYKPSFDIGHSRQSPGEVLLRQLLLAAIQEGAVRFDFGIGEEAFKARFANRTRRVENWGLYPVTERID